MGDVSPEEVGKISVRATQLIDLMSEDAAADNCEFRTEYLCELQQLFNQLLHFGMTEDNIAEEFGLSLEMVHSVCGARFGGEARTKLSRSPNRKDSIGCDWTFTF